MRIRKIGDNYLGTHITGPTHNMLAMQVRSSPNEAFAVTILPAAGDCSHGADLTAGETRVWIIAGVDRANAELGTCYGVERAEVVANDSRKPEVYTELARRIILTAHEDIKLD